jgi:hypothetical protein
MSSTAGSGQPFGSGRGTVDFLRVDGFVAVFAALGLRFEVTRTLEEWKDREILWTPRNRLAADDIVE